MNVLIRYHAQIRRAAGLDRETVEMPDGCTALEALQAVTHGDGFSALLFDEQRKLRPVILLLVNEVPAEPERKLQAGDQLSVFSPVAGG